MEKKYLRDFVIVLIVLLLLACGYWNYIQLGKANKVAEESKYKKIALSQELLDQIQELEESINDRKGFVFTVTKDPLEQNLIVKTQQDLEKQWREKIENMVRLTATILPQNGEKLASIAYQGSNDLYSIGDVFTLGKIVKISEGKIVYSYNGKNYSLTIEKLPPKPVEILNNNKSERSFNW